MLGVIVGFIVVLVTYLWFGTRGKKKRILKRSPYMDEGAGFKSPYPRNEGPFWTSDRTAECKIRLATSGVASKPSATIPETFRALLAEKGSKPALRAERPLPPYDKKIHKRVPPPMPFESWKTWTYQEYYDECIRVARGFVKLGLERYDGVNIFGFNSPEWVMGEIAAIFAGGIVAGIYPSDTLEQVIYKSTHSNTSIAICEADKAGIFKNAALAGELPNLKAIVVWGGDQADEKLECKGDQQIRILSWEDAQKIGEDVAEGVVENIMESQRPGHVASYIYTSGTTGHPKAVMITHDNILFESSTVVEMLGDVFDGGEERVISYLPLSHVAGAMTDIICPLVATNSTKGWFVVGFARPYDLKAGSIVDRLQCISPTMFLGVPRVWEKVAEKVKKKGANIKGLVKKISTFGKAKGLEHAMNCQMGGSGEYPALYTIAEKLVLKKVKTALGLTKCKFGFTGAAPISADTLGYFGALGISVNEVYGMSECTGATTWSLDNAHVWGSCGFAMPGTEVKIFRCNSDDMNDKKECPLAVDIFNATEEEQGEICFRGRHIMAGYMANPALGEEHVAAINEKNRGAIDDEGWLHSGDKGCMGQNGMLKITGRYKELIIGAGGENIAPVPIEDEIKKICPIISNILMIGDKRKFNVAVITLKAKGATGESPGTDDLDGEAAALKPSVTTISQAMQDETFIKTITDAITATNNNTAVVPSNPAKIQKFTILPADFSVETGEMTPTLKTKRSVVDKKHKEVIDRMYAPENIRNAYIPFYA
jgi:long-chain-fatty-acid--CoA ligase ACSBG